ncbi:MAG: DNA-binding protein [Clostridia bacterium]|nr:DNA-binding protein [Clostridia bacterium]
MAQNLEITMLVDIYGAMLTDKQRDFLSLYYDEDLSLAEIAANEGITRQGVRDAIKRAEAQLLDIESKLGFEKRFRENLQKIDDIRQVVAEIKKYNSYHGMSKELGAKADRIEELLGQLTETQ